MDKLKKKTMRVSNLKGIISFQFEKNGPFSFPINDMRTGFMFNRADEYRTK